MQLVDDTQEERMLRHGAHRIVAYPCRHGTSYPCWVREEWIETAIASIIEINIYAAVESEDEVADRVGALDGEGVIVEGVEEPGVFCFDEVAGKFVGPELCLDQLHFVLSHRT